MTGKLCLPSNSVPILPAPAAASPPAAARHQNKRRIIACVSCHKQKKKCDNERPCTRCATTGRQCTYPVKPPDRRYNSKKWKLPTPVASPSSFPSPPIHHPLPFPAALWPSYDQPPCRHQQQQSPGLPSPSPSTSTVGTPQPSYASSSYGDSIPATPATGNGQEGSADLGGSSGYPAVGPLKDLVNPRGVIGVVSLPTPSPVPAPQPVTTEAAPRFDIPDLIDQLLKGAPYKSHYANAPLFGLEEPTPIDFSNLDFSMFADATTGDATKDVEAFQDIGAASSDKRKRTTEFMDVGKAKHAKQMKYDLDSKQQRELKSSGSVKGVRQSGEVRGTAEPEIWPNPEWNKVIGEMDGDLDLSWLDPQDAMPEHMDFPELDFYMI